jgi:YVTN family beta-propeller protein
MRTPVETAVRNHLQTNDAVQETIEWAEIVSRLERGSSPIVVPRRSSRRGLWVAAAAVVITILLIGVIPLLFNNDDEPVGVVGPVSPEATDVIDIGGSESDQPVAADGAYWQAQRGETGLLLRIDAVTLEVTDTIPVGEDPVQLFPTEDGIWVLDSGGELFLVDTSTRQVIDSIEIPIRVGTEFTGSGELSTPVLVGQTLWVHTNEVTTPMVVEVDLASRTVVSETPVGINSPQWAEEIDGAIWSHDDSVLMRFDLESYVSEEVIEVDLGHADPCCFVFDDAIWMVDNDGIVHRFDLETRVISDSVEIGEHLNGAIAAAGAVWVSAHDSDESGAATGEAGSVYRIDLETRQITDVIPVGSSPWQPVFADGAIWVANGGDGTVSRIDTETRQVTHTIQVGNHPYTPSVFDGAIWVPNLDDGTITRIKTR